MAELFRSVKYDHFNPEICLEVPQLLWIYNSRKIIDSPFQEIRWICSFRIMSEGSVCESEPTASAFFICSTKTFFRNNTLLENPILWGGDWKTNRKPMENQCSSFRIWVDHLAPLSWDRCFHKTWKRRTEHLLDGFFNKKVRFLGSQVAWELFGWFIMMSFPCVGFQKWGDLQ